MTHDIMQTMRNKNTNSDKHKDNQWINNNGRYTTRITTPSLAHTHTVKCPPHYMCVYNVLYCTILHCNALCGDTLLSSPLTLFTPKPDTADRSFLFRGSDSTMSWVHA